MLRRGFCNRRGGPLKALHRVGVKLDFVLGFFYHEDENLGPGKF